MPNKYKDIANFKIFAIIIQFCFNLTNSMRQNVGIIEFSSILVYSSIL